MPLKRWVKAIRGVSLRSVSVRVAPWPEATRRIASPLTLAVSVVIRASLPGGFAAASVPLWRSRTVPFAGLAGGSNVGQVALIEGIDSRHSAGSTKSPERPARASSGRSIGYQRRAPVSSVVNGQPPSETTSAAATST